LFALVRRPATLRRSPPPIDRTPLDGPPSSAHSGRNRGGRTIGPALRAGRAFARSLRKPTCGVDAAGHGRGRYASRKGRLEEGDQVLGDGFGVEQWGEVNDALRLSDGRVDDVLGQVAFHVGEEGAE